MATYVNDLRLKEITTGDESGTWGASTNTNLELIGEALGYNTQDCFSSDADATTTVADGVSDPARAMYFKVTSSATLTATRTLTVGPNTISRVMFIENATTGSQSITISQGSGANVTISNGRTTVVYLDGAGAAAAVVDALALVDPGVTDTLAETLVAGNTSGGTGLTMSSGDDLTLTGASYNVVWDSSDSALEFADSAKAVFGTGGDLEIFHNASNSIINDGGTGNLQLQTGGATKLEVTSGGVTVTGVMTGDVTGDLTGTVITAAQANITSVGTLTSLAVSGDLTVDTNTLKVDSTNNRVGVLNASPAVSLDAGSATDAFHVPVGTTAQRPSGAAGHFRYNTTLEQFEGYTDDWGQIGGGGGANAFATDSYTGDGSTTAYALSQVVVSEDNLLVFIEGVFQQQDAYSIATAGGTTTLTFSAAPANGNDILIYSVVSAISGTNLNSDTMTGDGSDTTLTLSLAPVNENNTQVYIDGVYQNKDTYSISGTTLTFSAAPPNGSAVEVMTMNQLDINTPTDGSVTPAKIASGDFYFDTDTLYIDATNNRVGVGTSSPSAPLNISATYSSDTTEQFRVQDNTGGKLDFFGYATGAKGIQAYADDGSTFYNLNLQPLGGNVGINQSAPISPLDVTLESTGQRRFLVNYDDSAITIKGSNATSAPESLRVVADTFKVNTGTTGSGTEAMRIDANGNLLVGTTSYESAGPAMLSAVEGLRIFSNKNALVVTGSDGAGGYEPLALTRKGDNGAVVTFWHDYDIALRSGDITITSSSVAYNTSSDARLKDNIVDAPSASNDIDAIQVRSFDWKADGSHQKYGMVAQELLEVAPEAVSQGATEEDMMGVDYSKLVPMMIKEIQSLRREVEALKENN